MGGRWDGGGGGGGEGGGGEITQLLTETHSSTRCQSRVPTYLYTALRGAML